jgi:type III secretory pathway component EscV
MFIDFRKILKIVDESNNQWINASFALTIMLLLLLIIGLIICFPDIASITLCIIILSVIIKGIRELVKEYRGK